MSYIWESKNWPEFTWQSDRIINLLSRARLAQGKLLSRISVLGFEDKQNSRAEILINETIKTAFIEGERFDEKGVRSSVALRLNLPSAGVSRSDRKAEGLIDILIDATENYDKALSPGRLKSWQAALFPTGYSGLLKISTGSYRKNEPMQVISGPISKETVHFEAPPGKKIKSEMDKFMKWWDVSRKNMDGLIRAAVAHFYFVTIHPFEDGNGRIARALTDMALAQDENMPSRYYSLSGRIVVERKSYYDVLEKCQKGTLDITEWLEWFLNCYLNAVKDSEFLVKNILLKSAFWQKHSQTLFNTNQQKVLNRLLDAGEKGFEGALTTRKYVGMTRVSRATAYRDILDLVEKKVVKQNKAKGRSVSYSIIYP